jgi:uncharacterized protein (DUF58 family)
MMESPEVRPLASAPWLFSRQGLSLLALTTAIAATFLATDVAYLAGALLLVGLGAHAWSRLAFARLSYSRKPSRARAFRGDAIFEESSLVNPRLLPLPWAEVWEQLPAALAPEGQIERSYAAPDRVWVRRGLALWPYQRVRWRRPMACTRRGVFDLGLVYIRTGDPFGFFERERVLADRQSILVYPRVVPLRRVALPLHHPSLDVVSPSSPVADPTRTAAIRDYRPEDPQRLIHWASTARRGRLQVRVLEPATSLHVSLLLEVRGFGFGTYLTDLLELTLDALASIGTFVHSRAVPVALLANTDPPLVIPPGASVPHLQVMLESLARLRPAAGPNLLPWALEHLPPGDTVVLAASDLAPDLSRSRARLQEGGFHTLLLLATSDQGARRQTTEAIALTPGCDVAQRLEGIG